MTSNMEKGEAAKGKIKISLIVLEILIALGILAIPLFWVQRIARAASTGNAMMSYWDAGAADYDLPRYQTWNGSSWSDEATAQDINSSPYWIVLRSCPKRNEKILGTQDATSASEDVEVQVWDGTSWGNYKKASDDTGTTAKRAFDIAYEQSSGDAIVVFGVDTLTTPKYYSWNGSAWGTTAEDCANIGSGEVEWVKMASKPGADEIVLVTQDANNDIWAQVWSGSAWGNAVNLTTATDVGTNQCFDVAYEQSRKRAMIVYTTLDNNIPKYSMWNTTDLWVAGGSATPTATAGDDLRWVKLAARPGSNELLLGVSDDAYDLNVQLWYSGASETWSNATTEVIGGTLKSLPTLSFRCFNVAYESTSGEGMVVWSDNDETAEYCIWDGSSWSGGSTAMSATATYSVAWVALTSHPDSNEIMLMTSNYGGSGAFDDEYNVKKWDGSSWSGLKNVETAGYTGYESFAIDYDRHSPQVSIIIQKWRELYH